jgi:hypothetical protein
MNMNRRKFLQSTAAAVAVATIPFKLGHADDKNRTVEIDTEDGWQQIEMNYLKAGDIFRIRENGVTVSPIVRAAGKPTVEDDIWGVRVYKEK